MNYLADAYDIIAELEKAPYQNNVIPYLKTKYLLAINEDFWAKEYYARTISRNLITPSQQLFLGDVRWISRDIQGTIMAYEHGDQTAEAEGYNLAFQNEISLKKPRLFLHNGDWRSAEPLMKSLEPVLTMDFSSLYIKTGVYLMGDKKEAAKESLVRMEIIAEENPYRLTKFGNLHKLVDSLEKADRYYDRALKVDKIKFDAMLGKINILKEKKKTDEAINYLENMNHPIIYNSLLYPELVSLYKEKGDYKKARNFINELIDIAPGDIDRYKMAIELASKANNPDDIEPVIQSCLENNPNNALAQLLAGKYYLETGQNEKAEEYLQMTASSNIPLFEVYYHLGLLMESKGDTDSALVCYQNSFDNNQFFAKAYGRAAGVMINRENIDDRSMAMLMNYTRMAQRGEHSPEDLITMGRGQFRQEKYKQARRSFERALEADPKNPVYNYYAGINYIKLDSLQKARTHLNKAIKNGLTGDLKSKAEKALGKL
jgi:tetratricopeptide (TPR) repeat protein